MKECSNLIDHYIYHNIHGLTNGRSIQYRLTIFESEC